MNAAKAFLRKAKAAAAVVSGIELAEKIKKESSRSASWAERWRGCRSSGKLPWLHNRDHSQSRGQSRSNTIHSPLSKSYAHPYWDRFTVHSTPMHGSWLNQAEIEISAMVGQCLGKRRMGSTSLESSRQPCQVENRLDFRPASGSSEV